jgi:hypothetical protein
MLCCKSLSSAAEDEAGEGFSVEVQNYRIEVLFGWLPTNTIYCLLAHPNPSAENKATDSANNKERLDVCHDIVWCRTTSRAGQKVLLVKVGFAWIEPPLYDVVRPSSKTQSTLYKYSLPRRRG